MLFLYLNVVGISDGIWLIGVFLLNLNMLFLFLGFSVVGNGEQFLQDQMFNYNVGVVVFINVYLSSLSYNFQGFLVLYFFGILIDILWGE